MANFTETESIIMDSGGWGERGGDLLCTGHRVSVWEDDEVIEMAGTVARHCQCT